MDAQQARNFLYGVKDLECLETMPELVEGIKEAADLFEDLRKLLNKEDKEKTYYMQQIDKQIDHIATLEELVMGWQGFAELLGDEHGYKDDEELKRLQEKTVQLLGEK